MKLCIVILSRISLILLNTYYLNIFLDYWEQLSSVNDQVNELLSKILIFVSNV